MTKTHKALNWRAPVEQLTDSRCGPHLSHASHWKQQWRSCWITLGEQTRIRVRIGDEFTLFWVQIARRGECQNRLCPRESLHQRVMLVRMVWSRALEIQASCWANTAAQQCTNCEVGVEPGSAPLATLPSCAHWSLGRHCSRILFSSADCWQSVLLVKL